MGRRTVVVCGLLFWFCTAQSQTFEFGTVVNGVSPSGSGPWLTARFSTLSPGKVELRLEAHLSVPSEFIGEVALNLNPAISLAELSVVQVPESAGYVVEQPAPGDSVSLTGGGSSGRGFDLGIQFLSSAGQSRFDGAKVRVFNLSGPADLTAEDFLFHNTVGGQEGLFLLGVHVHGIAALDGGTTSSVLVQTVPEPGVVSLAVLALVVFGARKRFGRGCGL